MTLAGSVGNVLLMTFKFIASILGHSSAMIADAVHSLSDFITDLIVLVFVKISAKPQDESHDYGHGKFETFATFFVGLALVAAAIGIITTGGIKLMSWMGGEELEAPGQLALWAALVSLLVKEGLFRYTRRVARKVSSPALMAGAWHHRSDALSSVGALIGIGGAMLGFPAADAAASLVICVFIGKAAFDISSEAVRGMVDRSADAETEEAIRRSVLNVAGVEGVDLLHTRSFGSRVYVEIEIRADGRLSLFEAHAIAEDVHNRVEAAFPQVKHIMVHVNPVGEQ